MNREILMPLYKEFQSVYLTIDEFAFRIMRICQWSITDKYSVPIILHNHDWMRLWYDPPTTQTRESVIVVNREWLTHTRHDWSFDCTGLVRFSVNWNIACTGTKRSLKILLQRPTHAVLVPIGLRNLWFRVSISQSRYERKDQNIVSICKLSPVSQVYRGQNTI